jgi:hypothetical protein
MSLRNTFVLLSRNQNRNFSSWKWRRWIWGTKEYKVATYTFNDALSRDFVGLSVTNWWNNVKPSTVIRETVVADAGVYYASVNLADDVAVGSFTIQAETMFSQLIPSNQTETPLLDLKCSQ